MELQREDAAARVSGCRVCVAPLPGAGESGGLAGGSGAKQLVKELQEQVSSQEEKRIWQGPCGAKDHPKPCAATEGQPETTLEEPWMETPTEGKAGNLLLPATQKGSPSTCSSVTTKHAQWKKYIEKREIVDKRKAKKTRPWVRKGEAGACH